MRTQIPGVLQLGDVAPDFAAETTEFDRTASLPATATFEEAGLYRPDACDATERLNLLRLVAARGGSLEEMSAAAGDRELKRLAAELFFVRSPARHTIAELASTVGVSVDELSSLRRACGLEDVADAERCFFDGDAELATTFFEASELFGAEATAQLLRVITASMSRIADAAITTFVTTAGAASLTDDLALIETTTLAASLQDRLAGAMDTLLRHQLVRLARPNVTGTPAAFEVTRGAVGFVDLVGFTSLVQRIPLDEVGSLLTAFEATAIDVVAQRGGRVIKFVGDAVMLRTSTLAEACLAALDVIDRLDAFPLTARAGIAIGNVLVRDGDCFGPVVNLAARAARVAQPSTVVAATLEEFDDPADELAAAPLPPVQLPGFDQEVALRLMRRQEAAPREPGQACA